MRGAKERRYALASGDLDCIIGDISTVIFGVANAEQKIAVTSTAFERIDGGRRLLLLGSGSNYMDVETLEDLLQRVDTNWQHSIVITRYTDIEFATDGLLSAFVGEVDERRVYQEATDDVTIFEFLIFGKVLAAVLPEPLATLATEKNSIPNGGILQPGDWAFVLSDYGGVELMPSVIVFRREFLAKEEQMRAFYSAYRETVELLNETPQETLVQIAIDMGLTVFRELYPSQEIESWEPPEGFEEIFDVPQFPQPRALEEDEFEAVAQWALTKGYIRTGSPPAYAEVVDSSFIAS